MPAWDLRRRSRAAGRSRPTRPSQRTCRAWGGRRRSRGGRAPDEPQGGRRCHARELPLNVVRNRGDALELDLELRTMGTWRRVRPVQRARRAEGRPAVERARECVCAWIWGWHMAPTWKGFSNRAGLSRTVTFVTVTHAILRALTRRAQDLGRDLEAAQEGRNLLDECRAVPGSITGPGTRGLGQIAHARVPALVCTPLRAPGQLTRRRSGSRRPAKPVRRRARGSAFTGQKATTCPQCLFTYTC